MDFGEFREFGHASIEFIINYLSNLRDRNVLSNVQPYEIVNQLPKNMPEQPEHWRKVLNDLETIIVPGLTHWQSPYFNAFFPSATSAGSIIGELLIAGIGVLGFSWYMVYFVNEMKSRQQSCQHNKKVSISCKGGGRRFKSASKEKQHFSLGTV